jgi:hypothetical protein
MVRSPSGQKSEWIACKPTLSNQDSLAPCDGFDCDSCPLAPGQCDVFDPKKKWRAETARRQEVENFGTELNVSFWFFSSSNSCSSPEISVQNRV